MHQVRLLLHPSQQAPFPPRRFLQILWDTHRVLHLSKQLALKHMVEHVLAGLPSLDPHGAGGSRGSLVTFLDARWHKEEGTAMHGVLAVLQTV